MNAKRIPRPFHAIPACCGAVALAVFAYGCAVGPNYKPVRTDPPAEFRFSNTNGSNSLADLPWRAVFTDPYLQPLIESSLASNHDLQQAAARVQQARYAAVAARSQFFPQIGYGGDIGRGRNSLFNVPTPLNGTTESSVITTVNAAWEIDFWGRIRRLNEAARAQYLATEEARRSLTISLISDVAITYYQLLDLDQELQIQIAATNAYAGSYRIFNDRRVNGVTSKLETDRAAAALATAAAIIPQLEAEIGATENRLSILLGRNPGSISRSSLTNLTAAGPDVPAGLTGDLLRRRPDVLASEQALIAANASIGVSVANFFPRIGLTTFLGRESPELDAFTGGAGNIWNVGGTMAGPLFQGGRLHAEYKGAQARYDEAVAAYRQTVITAFQEVSDALISRQKLAEARTFNDQAVVALSSAVGLATDRYMNGHASYFEVLQAQEELYPAQRLQAQVQAGEWIAYIQIYKALGGGWSAPGDPRYSAFQPEIGVPNAQTTAENYEQERQ